jgi:DNA-binding PadR family transcriptional regulator
MEMPVMLDKEVKRGSTEMLILALYRMEKRGLIKGTWIEKAGQWRRRYYKLMPEGKKALNEQRQRWSGFFAALDRVAKINPA